MKRGKNLSEKTLSEAGDIEAAILAGSAVTGISHRFVVLDGDDGTKVVMGVGDDGRLAVLSSVTEALRIRRAAPGRRAGTCTLETRESFCAHVNRNKVPEQTTIWANRSEFSMTAVYDDYPSESQNAAWREHRAFYPMPMSPEWSIWMSGSGNGMGQEEFANFIEERVDEIVAVEGFPDAATLLEMARGLVIHSKGTFQRSIDPTTGTSSLICKTEHEKSSTQIPKSFLLALRVLEGGARYRIEASIQFSLRDGRPRFAYTLKRASETVSDAFDDVVEAIQDATGLPVFFGVAPK